MEGISHQAASLPGHLGPSKLNSPYDDNEICVGGSTGFTFAEDAQGRFRA